MKSGEKLGQDQIEGLAMEFTVRVMLDTISQHGYKGSSLIVNEFFRTLDELLDEFNSQNQHRAARNSASN